MNMPSLQYTTLCIFGLLNLRRTALAIHIQTCDTRILLIVLACHRTLALYINSRYNPTFSEKKKVQKPIQITIKVKRSWPFQAFVNLQEKKKHLQSIFSPKLHHCLPSRCHIFPLCSFSSFWHALGNFHICLCALVESQPNWRSEDALRSVPYNSHHLLLETFLRRSAAH